MVEYCEENAIFFYKAVDQHEKRLLPPKRKDSSKVTLNGVVRHRGSMLDLLYESPDMKMIEELMHNYNGKDRSGSYAFRRGKSSDFSNTDGRRASEKAADI